LTRCLEETYNYLVNRQKIQKVSSQIFDWRAIYMQHVTVLVGGKTGYGINDAGVMICRLFGRLGYRIYMYNDFPSLIKGGHQFVIVRASRAQIAAHTGQVDVVIAFNQDAIDLHKDMFNEKTFIIYDSENVKTDGLNQPGIGLPLGEIIREEGGTANLGNHCMLGGLCRALDIDWSILEALFSKHNKDNLDLGLKVARRGFDQLKKYDSLENTGQQVLPVLNGCHAISLGLLKAGLQAYVAYPMTPTSPVLEFFAKYEREIGLQVVTPESEIAVILMALGYSYMGIKSAVGTSGGGLSLMVEGLGLAGQAELPAVIVVGQRAGPSTGMPTYTAQADLNFVLNAGHGEFPRLIVAPGDPEEAYYWSGVAMNKAWKYQMPAFILADKTLCLGMYSFDLSLAPELNEEKPVLWDGQGRYERYKNTAGGVSPLAFAPLKGQAVKATSYVHDEYGLTSEEPAVAKAIADKRLLKERNLAAELEGFETVKVYNEGKTALLCWGSNKGVCIETANKYGLRVIQLLVLSPFPEKALAEALQGVDKVIDVECNSQGQLAQLLKQHGFRVDEKILKYDGRPFSIEELENEVKKVIK
jgi:2-oxoglutarate/2-oxoacid ferredoxin oxidoreductase subunit alpha